MINDTQTRFVFFIFFVFLQSITPIIKGKISAWED